MGGGSSWRGAALVVLLLLLNLYVTPAAATTYEVTEIWTTTLAGGVTPDAMAADPTFDHFAVGSAGILNYVNSTGGLEWTVDLTTAETGANSVAATDVIGKIVHSDHDVAAYINSTVYLVDASTGAVKWSYFNPSDTTTFNDIDAIETVYGYTVVAVASDAYVYIFNEAGSVFSYYGALGWNSVAIYDPDTVNDGWDVIAGYNDGYIYDLEFNTMSSTYDQVWILEITGSSSGTVTNYPFRVNISTAGCTLSTTAHTNPTLCLPGGTIRSTFDDIRVYVTGWTATTAVPYWIEEHDSYNASMWIKIPTITAGSTYNSVRIDLGKGGDSNAEDGMQVFTFFHDDYISPALNGTKWYWWNGTTTGYFHNGQINSSVWELCGWGGMTGNYGGPVLQSNNATMGWFYENTSWRVKFQTIYHTPALISFSDQDPSATHANSTANGVSLVLSENEGVYCDLRNSTSPNWTRVSFWPGEDTCCSPGQNSYTWYVADIGRRYYVAGSTPYSQSSFDVFRGESNWGGVNPWNVNYPFLYPNKTKSYKFNELATQTSMATPWGKRLMGRIDTLLSYGNIHIDWAFLRNVTTPEPTVTGWYGPWNMTTPPVPGSSLIDPHAPNIYYSYQYASAGMKNYGTAFSSMDTDLEHNGWVTWSNSTYHASSQWSAATHSFSSPYTYVSSSGTPTARTKTSAMSAFSIEGRGAGIIDIIRLDGTRVGTYTAGGMINAVDISENGLYAVAGGEDGQVYFFGKASSSSWQLLDTSAMGQSVEALIISDDGKYVLAGRDDGKLTLYKIGEQSSGAFSQTLHFVKDGVPAVGYTVTVEDGGTTGLVYTTLVSGAATDSNGDLVFLGEAGHYYRITVDGQVKTIQASTSYPTLYVVWSSPTYTLDYGAIYNQTNNSVEMWYTDDLTSTVVFSVVNNSGYEVYTRTYTGNEDRPVWHPPAGNETYMIRISAERPTGTVGCTRFVKTGTAAVVPFLPIANQLVVNILLTAFLMVVAGLFGYAHAPMGALFTSIMAGAFTYLGWVTFPWFWVLACIFIAFLSMVARGADR